MKGCGTAALVSGNGPLTPKYSNPLDPVQHRRRTVAVANAFKPHVATYTKAAEIVGVRMDEVLFIANHAFDCIGAKSASMRTAFIDRRRRPFGVTPHQPDLVVPTYAGSCKCLDLNSAPTARRFG
jgi:FMN phosphatase YigB (HAD superfamily)